MSISSTDLNPAAGKGPTVRRGTPPIRANHTGLVTAALFAVWHLVWSAFVATGVAQPVIDFVFWMHFIKPVYVVEPFSAGRAVTLVVVTAIVGYILGSAFALLWNRVRR
jgi:hypothetical protein